MLLLTCGEDALRFMTAPRFSVSHRWLLGRLLALFLIIVGAKLVVISLYSSPLPFFDQWQGEGKNLLIPWVEGRLSWADLFAPHNDHRILWTRLLVLGLFVLNQQWDTQVEMIVAAGLHALCAVVLGWIIIRRLGRQWETPILIALLLLFGLPFDWEDTLSGGFQSQFYFLILFSIVTIWGLAAHPPASWKWWAGVGAAVASWFSIASGPLATAAVAGWMILRLFRGAGPRRSSWFTLLTALVLTITGLSLRPTNGMPGALDPKSPLDFVTVFAGLLSWPVQSPFAAGVMYLPLAMLLWKWLRTPVANRPDRASDFLIPLGCWIVLQTAALAYVRNRYSDPLQISRYMVLFAPGVLVNLGCVAVLARDWPVWQIRGRRRTLGFSLALITLALLLFNLGRLTREALHGHLPTMKENNNRQRENIAAFLASGGNPKTFEGKSVHDLQSDFIPELMELLRNPSLRRILPASVHAPLEFAPEQNRHFELVARKPSIAGEIVEPAWTTVPLAVGQVAVFKSKEIQTPFPYVELAVTGRAAVEGSVLALVGGGESVVLVPGAREPGSSWARVVAKVPASPFHLEAVCRGGDEAGFAFTLPRPVGRLSGWAQAVMQKDVEVLVAGLLLWIALSFGEKFATREEPDSVERA